MTGVAQFADRQIGYASSALIAASKSGVDCFRAASTRTRATNGKRPVDVGVLVRSGLLGLCAFADISNGVGSVKGIT